ncbi:MAG: putative manganese-dependent inorganic diphosphatase [Lachnospiraceae bacterium]|nr:putative manganese-dependent inorganic diphosphatase [Lachnospiraceae bacterium]
MNDNKKEVWVIGHKNPDTDSVCSAIAYSYLKNQTDEGHYVPKKAGSLNEETRYVLRCFGAQEPETVKDVGTQLSDMDYSHTPGVDGHLSLKNAWDLMQSTGVVTLPVVSTSGMLKGVIVNGDIAYSYMDVYDNATLSQSRTQYKNIVDTLNGKLVCGNEHAFFNKGKVVVAVGDTETVQEEIDGDDLVILGNVVKRQLLVLEEIPSCMVLTGVTEVDPEVKSTAEAIDCVIITTEYDTFTTARLMYQSIPISHFMTKDDVVSFSINDYVDEVKDAISKIRHRDFPILDEDNKYVGMFSRRHLISPQKKNIILVDHNEKNQAVDRIEEAQLLEIIDHHKIGSMETMTPIFFRNMPLGCCCTIIYEIYQENNVEIPKDIAGLMLSAILSDTLMFRSPTCTKTDEEAANRLAEIAGVEIEEHAMKMFEAGSNFAGKTVGELFYQDFKTFHQDEIDFGVSQISAVSKKQLEAKAEELIAYMETVKGDRNLDMVFVLLTNIFEQSSRILYYGNGAKELIEEAFPGKMNEEGIAILPGVVSRKKQVIPAILSALMDEE